MPLQHAVLALLAAKPAHGYELRTSFEEAVGTLVSTILPILRLRRLDIAAALSGRT